jgi:cobalt-zinc-cadmium efflux system membrane fusion protein
VRSEKGKEKRKKKKAKRNKKAGEYIAMSNNKLIITITLVVGIIIGMIVKEMVFSVNDSHTSDGIAHQEGADGHKEADEESAHGEEIARLSDAELQEFGIELAEAGEGQIQLHIDLTGEIKIDPDRLAHIFPRFPGIVREVRKKIGDRVKKGEVLAIIESNESLSPYEVTSLIDGTVIEMHLTKGEVINDASHDIVVADLSYVWADLNVYQKDLQYIQSGQRVAISGGAKMPEAQGKISYISPVLNESTRTAIARVVLPNPDGRWRPGLFVNGRVVTETVAVPLAIPKTALETYEDQTVVFVKTADGFKPQPVSIGRSNRTHVEILEGLKPGQTYVAKGAFTLKAEIQKESFGGGHGH